MSTALERWATQDAEWRTIRDELVTTARGRGVTAYQVSLEQRKRMLARGERPVMYEEIIAEAEASPVVYHFAIPFSGCLMLPECGLRVDGMVSTQNVAEVTCPECKATEAFELTVKLQ